MNKTTESYKGALNCPICMGTFASPKILSCGHSFCLTCLTEVAKQHEPTCPLCRTPIILPPSGNIEDLPTNFSVQDMLEMLENAGDQEEPSQAISGHIEEGGDYVCMSCLEQICSCCKLSFHTSKKHKCISVSEFTEKLRQDVSKMVTGINGLSWPEQTEPFKTVSSIMPTYLNLKKTISTTCDEILQSLNGEMLNLRTIRQLQKQVRKDHTKFKAACEALKQEIREAKRQKVLKEQFAEYRQKLVTLKLPENVYKNISFRLKIVPFETLKVNTEALSESLSQQLKTKSVDIITMQGKLHDIGNNIGVLEHYIKDIRQEYRSFLLREIGITEDVVEPHHVFRIMEAVDVMNFGSFRHSSGIMFKCNELIQKFVESRDHVHTCCEKLLKEFHGRPLQLATVERKVVAILEEMENCNECYENIYQVIGTNFVNYDRSYVKECMQKYILDQDTVYVLQSTSNGITPSVAGLLREFETYKQATKNQCKDLMRYVLADPDTIVVHKKMKEIEIRIQTLKYRHEHLKNLSSMVLRCHKIMEEFGRFVLTEQTETAKVRKCYEHREEVQRLWRLILCYKPKTISFDVQVIAMHAKIMEERRNNIATVIIPSNSELNDLSKNMLKITQIMELRARLYNGLHGIPNNLQDSYRRHRQKLKTLNLVSDVADNDVKKMISRVQSYDLQDLLILSKQEKVLNKLIKEICDAFTTECFWVHEIALVKSKHSKHALDWLPQFIIAETKSEEWKIPDLIRENQYQWKAIADAAKSDTFDVRVLGNHLDRLLSLNDKVNAISTQISLACLRAVFGFVFLVVCIVFLGWKSGKV